MGALVKVDRGRDLDYRPTHHPPHPIRTPRTWGSRMLSLDLPPDGDAIVAHCKPTTDIAICASPGCNQLRFLRFLFGELAFEVGE